MSTKELNDDELSIVEQLLDNAESEVSVNLAYKDWSGVPKILASVCETWLREGKHILCYAERSRHHVPTRVLLTQAFKAKKLDELVYRGLSITARNASLLFCDATKDVPRGIEPDIIIISNHISQHCFQSAIVPYLRSEKPPILFRFVKVES